MKNLLLQITIYIITKWEFSVFRCFIGNDGISFMNTNRNCICQDWLQGAVCIEVIYCLFCKTHTSHQTVQIMLYFKWKHHVTIFILKAIEHFICRNFQLCKDRSQFTRINESSKCRYLYTLSLIRYGYSWAFSIIGCIQIHISIDHTWFWNLFSIRTSYSPSCEVSCAINILIICSVSQVGSCTCIKGFLICSFTCMECYGYRFCFNRIEYCIFFTDEVCMSCMIFTIRRIQSPSGNIRITRSTCCWIHVVGSIQINCFTLQHFHHGNLFFTCCIHIADRNSISCFFLEYCMDDSIGIKGNLITHTINGITVTNSPSNKDHCFRGVNISKIRNIVFSAFYNIFDTFLIVRRRIAAEIDCQLNICFTDNCIQCCIFDNIVVVTADDVAILICPVFKLFIWSKIINTPLQIHIPAWQYLFLKDSVFTTIICNSNRIRKYCLKDDIFIHDYFLIIFIYFTGLYILPSDDTFIFWQTYWNVITCIVNIGKWIWTMFRKKNKLSISCFVIDVSSFSPYSIVIRISSDLLIIGSDRCIWRTDCPTNEVFSFRMCVVACITWWYPCTFRILHLYCFTGSFSWMIRNCIHFLLCFSTCTDHRRNHHVFCSSDCFVAAVFFVTVKASICLPATDILTFRQVYFIHEITKIDFASLGKCIKLIFHSIRIMESNCNLICKNWFKSYITTCSIPLIIYTLIWIITFNPAK